MHENPEISDFPQCGFCTWIRHTLRLQPPQKKKMQECPICIEHQDAHIACTQCVYAICLHCYEQLVSRNPSPSCPFCRMQYPGHNNNAVNNLPPLEPVPPPPLPARQRINQGRRRIITQMGWFGGGGRRQVAVRAASPPLHHLSPPITPPTRRRRFVFQSPLPQSTPLSHIR